MSPSAQSLASEMRGCPFCGKPIRVGAMQCPYCREAVPHVQVASRVASGEGNAKIRRGLLYILLGGIVHYFAAGYSGFTLPVTVPPVVTTYGTPLVFAFGFGLLLHGLFLHLRS